jgi:hypothetical protein
MEKWGDLVDGEEARNISQVFVYVVEPEGWASIKPSKET